MKLDIIFGWHLDGPSYPEVPAVGRLTVGPIGMLAQLCLRLGFAPILPAYSVRIAEYMAMLAQLDDGNRFYSRSFETDCWGTAKMLLRMRDELVGSGWVVEHERPGPIESVPARLATFETLERLRNEKIHTSHDLVNPIIARLRDVQHVAIDTVTLVDDLDTLPPIWQRLIGLLKEKGVAIEHDQVGPSESNGTYRSDTSGEGSDDLSSTTSDVEKLRAAILLKEKVELTGDATFAILESDDEVQAADFVGRFLSAIDESESTVIIRGSSTAILDQFLRKQSLPSLGGGSNSALRGYVQALPLALELLWAPFDPVRMIEFLMVPKGPIPRFIARRFIQALRNQPGIGGGAWQSAWEDTRADLLSKRKVALGQDADIKNRFGEERQDEERLGVEPPDADIEKVVEAELQSLREWLEPPLFDTREGVPSNILVSICDRLRRHATMRLNTLPDASAEQFEVFAKAAYYAEVLSATIVATGAERIVRSQLLKIIESAMGDGYSPDEAEVSSWVPIDHPGQLLSSAKTVIWWGFIEQQMHTMMDPWTKDELTYLSERGAILEPSQQAVIREARSWRRPLLVSPNKLMFVKPRTVAGRSAAAHPFFHEILVAFEGVSPSVRNRIIRQAHECYLESKTEILDQTIEGQAVARRSLPGKRPVWNYRDGLFVPKRHTATSLERLLACPLSWLLKFQANLRFGNLLSVVSGEQLAGVLAHAVFAEIFSTDVWKTAIDTRARAEAEFDRLCPRLAAPLLQPGFSLERQRLKKAICDGASQLSVLIRDAGFSAVACEAVRTAVVDDIEITGRPDMVLKHPEHLDYVIDLKWSKSTIYRRREILEGRAIQLAVYAALEELQSQAKTEAGYFLIGQRQLLSASERHPFPLHSVVNGEQLSLTFDRLVSNAKTHLDYLEGGTAYATGFAPDIAETFNEAGVTIISDDEPELRASNIPDITMTLEPPCRVCEFGRLCGKKELNS